MDEQALAEEFDLEALPPGFIDNPYPVYRALQRHAPVKRMRNGSYFLTRYEDLMSIYRNTTVFSSDKKAEFAPKFGEAPLYEHHTTSLVFNDAPLHMRVRRLIVGALTPRVISSMEPALSALVERLLDAMQEREQVDLITDFAAAIPVEVIGNLLAVPMEDRGPLRDWSLAILGALEPVLTPEVLEAGNRAVTEFMAYLEGLVADRRAHPGDPERDVLTRLIQGEPDGERLTHKELLHNCIFLLNAGHETTTNMIGNGLVLLHDHPDQRRRLIERPRLITTAVEEILRYESSNQLGNRVTRAATEVGGVAMPEGTFVTLCIGAANRDPDVFGGDADVFDIGRTANRHLAFGGGFHLCAGLSLARLEGQVAINRLLQRFPDYVLTAPPVRGGRVRFRGFMSVPCTPMGR